MISQTTSETIRIIGFIIAFIFFWIMVYFWLHGTKSQRGFSAGVFIIGFLMFFNSYFFDVQETPREKKIRRDRSLQIFGERSKSDIFDGLNEIRKYDEYDI
jgi:hypothetical protein